VIQEVDMRSKGFSSRKVALWLPALSVALVGLCTAERAQAMPLITFSGSVRGLYGSSLGDPDLSPYAFGLGFTAGVTLPSSLYLGGAFDYFFGESDTLQGLDLNNSILQLQGRIGYDFGLGPFTLRPNLGLGWATASTELDRARVTDHYFVLTPGAEFLLGLGFLTASAEARYNKIFSDQGGDADALIFGLGLGLSF
jgi:hypothetical protein